MLISRVFSCFSCVLISSSVFFFFGLSMKVVFELCVGQKPEPGEFLSMKNDVGHVGKISAASARDHVM